MATTTVFDELEEAWARDPRTCRAVGEWADSPLLVGQTPADLTELAHRGIDRERSEAVLAALVCRVERDELAVLTVMHMLLPAAKGLAGRLRIDGDATERALVVVEVLWERIRTYPWQRRRGRVSGNVLADVVMVLTRARHQRSVAVTVWLDQGDRVSSEPPQRLPADRSVAAGEELLWVLADAVGQGWLDRDTARLIGRCRIGSIPADVLGAEHGIAAQSIRRRRQRAEGRLVTAMVAAA